MVPWPIALLTLFYGAIASTSAVALWKGCVGSSNGSLVWPLTWLALSGATMCGLPLLKPWARGLAVCTSTLLLVATLAIAGLFVFFGRPVVGLVTALVAGTHVVIIRYLGRPAIKALFM